MGGKWIKVLCEMLVLTTVASLCGCKRESAFSTDEMSVPSTSVPYEKVETNVIEYADSSFLTDMEESILTRMKNADTEDRTTLVNREIAYLNKYADAVFEDSYLQELLFL